MSDTSTPAPVPEADAAAQAAPSDSAAVSPVVVAGAASVEMPRLSVGQLVLAERPDRFGGEGATFRAYGMVLGVEETGVAVGWFASVSPSVPEADLEAL